MKRLSYKQTFLMAAVGFAVALSAATAMATPTPNAALINERIFNDCLISTVTTNNNYPTQVMIQDAGNSCVGFANLHNWRFSEDGGATEAVFNNGDAFTFCAEMTVTGDGEGEAGLQISPWWSQEVDGRFNCRTTDGEIACFGGRLPFYSFTGDQGVTYAKGEMIKLTVTYLPHDLTAANPATIEYEIDYLGNHYTSGPLAFDEGNAAEGYGTWGMLDDARCGGHVQVLWQSASPNATLRVEWNNICYDALSVPTKATTWGKIKSQF